MCLYIDKNKSLIIYIMRYFTIHNPETRRNVGKYGSERPILAAQKAADAIFRQSYTFNIRFCIQETTKNSKYRKYCYTAKKENGVIKVTSTKLKKQGGNSILGKNIYLRNLNNKYLHKSKEGIISEVDNANQASIWTVDEKQEEQNGKLVFYIYDENDNKVGLKKNSHTKMYELTSSISAQFYYEDGYLYPLTINILTKKDDYKLKVELVS
jgi:hypothetical protein